ncbi:acyltransferase [Pseudomonas sp. SWRI179]|uniref:acyltransferase family protein n=1 Tax=Pseudomonas sp. SWRI179 TaxID=2745497 RepID=UPI0016491F11|nr:acyltransferase [Pseudomonas sp. SWRI179]MBC3383359.1 acyltransferase [Pseudomonas sp. SWRI179]
MNLKRINEIDLLRFIAAMSVVFFHYTFRGYAADDRSLLPYPLLAPVAKYGYLGVELFFMISGFVIMMTAGGEGFRKFLISRAVRLYPAFWVCCSITFVVTLALGGDRFSATVPQYLGNLTLMGDFFDIRPIDGVYWSLFIEIRFYFLIALVMLFRKLHRIEALLCVWLVLSVALEFTDARGWRRFFITEYSTYFIAGAMFYHVWLSGASKLRWATIISSCAFAIYQGVNMLPRLERHYHVDFNAFIVATIIFICYVVMGLVAKKKMGWVAGRRWVVLGIITYPLYLLHQNVGFMVFNALYPAVNPHLLLWGTMALMIAMSLFIHVVFERAMARQLRRVLDHSSNKIAVLFTGGFERLKSYRPK